MSELKRELSEAFEEARQRTLDLIEPLDRDDLYRQHDPLMSPIAWDIGHIGNFEELWGVRSLPDSDEVFPELDDMYDAVKHPRSTRESLPLPDVSELQNYLATIRKVVLQKMEQHDLSSAGVRLLVDGFVYHMLLQHEYQHNETILQTLQLKKGEPYVPLLRQVSLPPGKAEIGGMIDVPGGEFVMGTDSIVGVYDNERNAHQIVLSPFRIGRAPVSNREFLAFVEEGGYQQREWWHPEGWAFVEEQNLTAPKYWSRDADGVWTTRVMNRVEPLNLQKPVMHICWYEAEAFARFAGMRLPTEAEWERAASWDSGSATKLLFPWGDQNWTPDLANLDMTGWGPAEIGAYPHGVSPVGCHQMIGDVWEWVASDFTAYPGFEAFPYDEYSAIFFGPHYKVLRGGSWATRPGAIRNTFRNWDFPIRRQIFSGMRLAADVV